MMRQRELAKPIVRHRLLNPIDAYDRLESIQGEWWLLDNPARIDITQTMREALLLQLDYLSGSTTRLKQDLSFFLKTRGRTARIEIVPFARPQASKLPAILIGPDNIAGVVVGSVHIDGESFVWVFLPKTGAPLVRTIAEERAERKPPRSEDPEYQAKLQAGIRKIEEAEKRLREVYAKKGISIPLPKKTAEERLLEGQRNLEAYENKTTRVKDKQSTREECIQNGIHLVQCSNLASWNILYIHEVGLADNWGVSGSASNAEQNASEK